MRRTVTAVLMLGLAVTGCTSGDAPEAADGQFGLADGAAPPTGAQSRTPAPSPVASSASPTAPVVLPSREIPAPSVTLPDAPTPATTGGVATTRPVSLPQYVPPDVSQSGIAISVAGTRYSPGQAIATSSQAAPELTGFTAYLLASGADGEITAVAAGTVAEGGRFALSFTPSGRVRIISAVAQAGITPEDPFNLDNVVARSSVVRIAPK